MNELAMVMVVVATCHKMIGWICTNISITRSETGFEHPASELFKIGTVTLIFILILYILIIVITGYSFNMSNQ